MQQHFAPTKPQVSVVMAVHNAEKTLRRAAESLQKQTLKNFELLAIDRGSTDATRRMLDALAERDLRIQVAHLDDCGLGEAMNFALSRARGHYLVFVDQDGWAEPAFLADLLKAAQESALDVAVGGFTLEVAVGGGKARGFDVESPAQVFATQHDFRSSAWHLFATGQLMPLAAKLFSRQLIDEKGIEFGPSSLTGHLFVVDALRDAERVGVVGSAGYHLGRTIPERLRFSSGEMGYALLEAEYEELLNLYRHWGLDGDPASLEMIQSRYIEQLAGCVESVCGWGSAASSAEQRRQVTQMINTDRAQLAANVAKPTTNSGRALLAPIRSKNVALVCVQARLMSLLRRGEPVDVLPDAFM